MHLARALVAGKLGSYPHKPGDTWVVVGHALHDLEKVFQAERDLIQDPRSLLEGGLLRVKNGETLKRGDACRVIMMNGVGTGYGDLLCGSVAIRELYRKLHEDYGLRPEIMLCCMPCHTQQYLDIFSRDPHVYAVQPAGIPLELFESAHFVATTEGLIADPAFNIGDMIQYFIGRFGISHPKHRKVRMYPNPTVVKAVKSAIRAAVNPPECLADIPSKGRKTCLLNFWASGYRRLPFAMFRPLTEILLSDGWRVWLSADNRGREALKRWMASMCKPTEDVHDISELATRSWSHFVGVASCADLIVTPDTSLVHVAGSLEKPCVGIFYSIEPILRINRYPTVVGFCGDNFRRGRLWGLHRPPDESKFNDAELDQDMTWTEPWRHCEIDDIKQAIDRAVAIGKAHHANAG